jgi:hypothetical protein
VTIDEITKLFDSYGRKARLYPAILAITPVIWTCAAIFPGLFTDGPMHLAITTIASIGGVYWLSAIARSCGKSLEPKLIHEWGGLPTTILLRHRNQTIDTYTKIRYHQKLSTLAGIAMPSATEEAADPADADQRYQSTIKRLLEARRAPEYELVHKENASYGFWRNLLGLKPIALPIMVTCFLAAVAACAVPFMVAGVTPKQPALIQDFAARWPLWFAIVADLVVVVLWIFTLDRRAVWQAGQQYAIALLRTLDKD